MRITLNPWTRRDLIALIALLLLAGTLRFIQLEVTDYHYDQATLVGMAQDLITGKHFPTEGLPASVGFPAPPTMDFLVALPYLINSNPLFVESCIVVLNLIGVALLYGIAQRYFSRTIALLTGLAYACNPWAIQYSREIWPPHLITPFVLAAIFCGLLGFVEGQRWAQILCLPLLSIAIAMHYGVTALLTVFVWFLWRKRASWRAVALSVAITLIMLIPFFTVFTASSIRAIEATMTQHRNGGWAVTAAIGVAARFASGAGVERVFGLASADYTARVPLVFWIIAAIPVVVGLIVVRKHPLAPLIYLWALSATVLLSILPVYTYDHYLVTCIPAFCLLAAIGLDAIVARTHPVVFVPWAAILAVECLLWFNLLSDARTLPASTFGPPLVNLLPIRQELSKASDVIIVGGVSGISGADVWSTMLFGKTTCVRELIIADGGITVFPAHPFDLLSAPGTKTLPSPYLSNASMQFPLRAGEGAYTITSFDQSPAWSGAALTEIKPAQFDNGVGLNGYAFADHRLYLEWTLPAQNQQDFQYFAHLLNASGDRVAQHDANFWPSKYWCANDRIVTWFDEDRPAGASTLRVGLYSLNNSQITNSNQVDPAGNALAPWVDIPLT